VRAGSLAPADLPKNLVLLGLVGLLDPPRKEAIEAVKECHGGGITRRDSGVVQECMVGLAGLELATKRL
jgi:hypothetical protein